MAMKRPFGDTTKSAYRCALLATLLVAVPVANADVVLDWNAIAVSTAIANGQNPFAQARYGAIVQLAVFEAVNAIKGDYQPYLGTIVAPPGASADAAAVQAAYRILSTYFPASQGTLDAERATSLASITDGQAKTNGIAVGEAAAAAMILARVNDGSSPAQFKTPGAAVPGEWQATPTCPTVNGAAVGILAHWPNVKPFGIPSASEFLIAPPPALTSTLYALSYNEVMRVGSDNTAERPDDRTKVATFYAVSSSVQLLDQAARQVAQAQGRTMSENARALALINVANNDSLVASMFNKYHYNVWRPETAIEAGESDGNSKTDGNPSYVPLIATPCFPSYPSNHGAGTGGGVEVLRRLYGEGGHSITLSNTAVPNTILQYTTFDQINDDVSDARVYGGIHFRFDQVAGQRLGRDVATEVYKNNLRPVQKD
jgi:hypothetical protein